MEVFESSEQMRHAVFQARREGATVGFVPTMGALHEGHRSLFRRALAENDRLAISLYVNENQFDTPEDARQYPSNLQRDKDIARQETVDYFFAPPDREIYPEGDCTRVSVESPITRCFEGAIRPNFFEGVARVVTKLLNIVPADRAYFGEKDLQQYITVRRLVKDLKLEPEIRPVPVKRDENGVACSSRNRGFSDEDWETAARVHQIMRDVKREADQVTRKELFEKYVPRLEEAGLDLQYLDVVRFPSYDPAWPGDEDSILIIAGYISDVRLKDNLPLHVDSVAQLEEKS